MGKKKVGLLSIQLSLIMVLLEVLLVGVAHRVRCWTS